MANRTVYARDEQLWQDAADYADAIDISLSALIERALENEIRGERLTNIARAKLHMIREILERK